MDLKDDVKKEARLRKAKRTRRVLIVVIILLLVVAVAGIAAGVYFLHSQDPAQSSIDKPLADSTDDATIKSKTVSTVPDLASLFGLSAADATAKLGSNAKMGTTSEATDSDVASVTQLVAVTITPEGLSSSTASSMAAKVYLSLDASGAVVKVNYSVPLGSLGNTDMLFTDLLNDSNFLTGVLTDSGTKVTGYTLTVPAESEYQTLTTGTDGKQTVSKESYTFSGNTALEAAPTVWSITYTFDRTAQSSSAQSSSVDDSSRMLYITLY